MKTNIVDIAPQLAYHFIDDAETIDNSEILKLNKDRIGKYYEYLGLLHDSWILKTTLTPQNFLLNLNNFTTHVFADALIAKKKLKVEDDKLVFKVDLDFEIESITFNTVDDDGFITTIKPVNADEYLCEDIISIQDELIEIGLIVWVSSCGSKPGQSILILIKANSISLIEHQAKDWEAVFGKEFDKYYNRFKAELLKGTFLSDQSRCEKLIDEIDGNTVNQH
jgi:hypothetical protein